MKISPAHGGHAFCWTKISSRNMKEVNPMNIHVKLQWNPMSGFGEEEFLNLHYMLYCENKPRPWRPFFFCPIKISSRNLEELHTRNINAKLQWNPISSFGEDFFLIYTMCYIVKLSPAHGGHVFCRIKISSGFNLKEVHPRKHSCQNTMKS